MLKKKEQKFIKTNVLTLERNTEKVMMLVLFLPLYWALTVCDGRRPSGVCKCRESRARLRANRTEPSTHNVYVRFAFFFFTFLCCFFLSIFRFLSLLWWFAIFLTFIIIVVSVSLDSPHSFQSRTIKWAMYGAAGCVLCVRNKRDTFGCKLWTQQTHVYGYGGAA